MMPDWSAERRPSLESIKTLLLEESASPFPSAGRRPARAGRPCYPFSHPIHSTTNYYIKSGQISHCETFEESRVIMSRFGKIGRLPSDIREQLNRRLQDGEIGKDLVVWLNSVPEVQAVLKAEFGERPVNEPNLSDWKAGGYEEWLVHQYTMEQVNQLVANAKELGGASQTPLSELLTTCLAARYVVELGRLTVARTPREGTRPTAEAEGDGGCGTEGRDSRLKAAFPEREAEGNGGGDLERLRKLCRDVLALRRLDLAAQRLRIEREAADREMRKEEEERKEKLLKAEQNRRMVQSGRQALRAAGHHLPYDPSIDDEAQMQKEVAVAELRRVRDKLAALQARLLKDMERQEKYDQEMEEFEQAEEEKLAREADTAKEGEKLAGEPEAAGAAAEGQPVGAQGEPKEAKGAGQTVCPAPFASFGSPCAPTGWPSAAAPAASGSPASFSPSFAVSASRANFSSSACSNSSISWSYFSCRSISFRSLACSAASLSRTRLRSATATSFCICASSSMLGSYGR